jgi:diguanylate cyclase (GGDEF)-like protein
LRVCTRASDVVARLGGDEFVVGWLGNAGSDVPSLLAGRIVEYASKLDVLGGGSRVRIGCTIGVARTDGFGNTLEEIIERADRALYIAKAEGRGRWHELSSETSDLTADRLVHPADAVRS